MSAHLPRVSIGLPVYNGEAYLRPALDSILGQDYPDFELIISDNASTDATPDICREYAARDARIRYYRNEQNIGATGNFNRVFELSRGEFFKWMPHDDECHPNFLRHCMEAFRSSAPDTVLVCSRSQFIDENGRVMYSSLLEMYSSAKAFKRLAWLLYNRTFPHPLWGLIRSAALRKTRLMGAIEADHVLLAELVLLGNFVQLPAEEQRWRIHARNAQRINKTPKELLLWHDPNRSVGRCLLPHGLQWLAEYFRAVRHVPLPVWDRMACNAMILMATLARGVQSCRNRIAIRTRLRRLVHGADMKGSET